MVRNFNLLDPNLDDDMKAFAEQAFIELRLGAIDALTRHGGEFDQLKSYALYVFDDKDVYRWVHTAPVPISSKLQRRQLYSEVCTDDFDVDLFPNKPKADDLYLVANYNNDKREVLQFTVQNWCEDQMILEMRMVDHENRRTYIPRKKSNLLRQAARQIGSASSSSSDENSDPKKSKATPDEDQTMGSSQKATKASKSKHQGKAKTFKRKTKRRGRV